MKEPHTGLNDLSGARSGRDFAMVLCGLTSLAALVVLVPGWMGGVEVLLRPSPASAPVTPACAVSLFLLSSATFLRLRPQGNNRLVFWGLTLLAVALSTSSLAVGIVHRPDPTVPDAPIWPPLGGMSVVAAMFTLLACASISTAEVGRRRLATHIAAFGISGAVTLTAVQIFQIAGPTMLPQLERLAVYSAALYALLFAALLADP